MSHSVIDDFLFMENEREKDRCFYLQCRDDKGEKEEEEHDDTKLEKKRKIVHGIRMDVCW